MTRNTIDEREDLNDEAGSTTNEEPVRRRRWPWVLVSTIAIAAAVGAAALPQQRDAAIAAVRAFVKPRPVATSAPRPPVVRTATVVAASGREARYTGVVHARYESALGFRVSGKIMERLVDAGDRVRKDQPLMRLDPTDLDLALRAAQSEVEAAQALATQASAEEVRQRALVDKNQASIQVYERGKAAADSAVAKLAAARAQEHQAEDQAAYAILHADADGVIMDTSGEPGQVVAVGQAVVRLARDGAREAEVYIPEGTQAAETGSAALYAHPDTWFPTKLREIAASADPQTRTFRARYVLDGDGGNAALGTTVTVRLSKPIAAPESVSVPDGAIFDDGGGPKVWVVDRASAKVAARSIRVLHVGDEEAAVAGDLSTGERVVAFGAHLLKAGEKVSVDRAPTDTAAR